MWRAFLIVLFACGASTKPASDPDDAPPVIVAIPTRTPEPIEPVPFGPDPIDDGTTKGAMAVPGEDSDRYLNADPVDERGVNYLDTTVTLDELPTVSATWQKRERVRYKGRVPIALHHGGHSGGIELVFVAPVDIAVSDYPGALRSFYLVPSQEGGPNGNAFSPLRWIERETNEGGSTGPIHAAVRVRPTRESPESTRRQVVVYVPPKTKVVLVATKLVSESTWTPLLRVDTPNATSIDLIDPGWH